MLTATTADPSAEATRPSTVRVVVRRRRVLSVLLGAVAGCALLAAAGVSAMWWLAALFVGLTAGYLGLVARLRHLRDRRRIDLAFGSDLREADEFDWRALERELHLALAPDASRAGQSPAPARPAEVTNRELGRFLLCWALGWVLTPVVTAIRLVRQDLSILEHQGIAHRIVRLQQFGRAQSLRVLTVGAAASVGITAVGGLTTTASAGASPTTAAVSTTHSGEAEASSTYTVVPGDTLSAIARRSGASVSELAAANHLADPNLILAGETLSIVGDGSATGASYLVRAGDTLSAIARRDGTTVAALVAANSIANPNLIFPGQVVALPPGTASPSVSAPAQPASHAAAPTSGAPTAATPGTAGPVARSQYVIRPGDTMAALARRYGTTISSLSATNHIGDPKRVYPGQLLIVPTVTNPQRPVAVAAAGQPVAAAPVASRPVASPPAVKPASGPISAPVPAPPVPAPVSVGANAAQSALPLALQFLRSGSVDQGVDYSAPGGTPLYAMGPGKIIREGMSGFGPNCPVLEISAGPLAGKTVYYGHAGANLVHTGDTVAAGQQISVVGYGIVGFSTGPHLEIGFYPPGGNGSGRAMLAYINRAVGHSTAG